MFVGVNMKFKINIRPLSYYQYLKQNRHRKYITDEGRKYKETLQAEFKKVMEEMEIIQGEVVMEIDLFFDNKRKNDLDNFCKPILDCMSDVIFLDDRQIIDLHIKKFYDKENPRIVIRIK